MNIIEYLLTTGEIACCYSFPDDEDAVVTRDGFGYLEGQAYQTTHYVNGGVIAERPASPVTLSDLTLFGVPAGSTLTINGERYDNVEGDVELEFPLTGTYSLRVECWPYKDWAGEVTV